MWSLTSGSLTSQYYKDISFCSSFQPKDENIPLCNHSRFYQTFQTFKEFWYWASIQVNGLFATYPNIGVNKNIFNQFKIEYDWKLKIQQGCTVNERVTWMKKTKWKTENNSFNFSKVIILNHQQSTICRWIFKHWSRNSSNLVKI